MPDVFSMEPVKGHGDGKKKSEIWEEELYFIVFVLACKTFAFTLKSLMMEII